MNFKNRRTRRSRIFRNILVNGLKPNFMPVMLRKFISRFAEPTEESKEAVLDWCRANARPSGVWALGYDEEIWREALEYAYAHETYAADKLSEVGVDLGGGGDYALLYFLVRYLKPLRVLETGVAAGHSSRALLTALHRNGQGQLWSSDFPYFRLQNPERYVGFLVEPPLRTSWRFELSGDAVNLPGLLAEAGSIDLFHYDSDKTERARRRAWKLVEPFLSENSVIIFDDIQDNWHFCKLVESTGRPYKIFEFKGKYLGLLLANDHAATHQRNNNEG